MSALILAVIFVTNGLITPFSGGLFRGQIMLTPGVKTHALFKKRTQVLLWTFYLTVKTGTVTDEFKSFQYDCMKNQKHEEHPLV